MTRFNVATHSWIPCVDVDGFHRQVSLIELFSDSSLKEFDGDATEKYCLLRFAGAIAQSSVANQPRNKNEWKAIRSTYTENTIQYLKYNVDMFWMDGDKPFLQFNPETEGDASDAYFTKNYNVKGLQPIQLREQYSNGNNVVLYQKQFKPNFTIEEIVRDLIVHLIFSPTLTHKGATCSRAMRFEKSQKGNLNIYATTLNIINSIWYNMEWSGDFGTPTWESRFLENNGILAKLVPMTVRIKIQPNLKEMYYYKGLSYTENIGNKQYHIEGYESKKSTSVERPKPIIRNGKWWRDFEIIAIGNKTNVFEYQRTVEVDALTIHTIGGEYHHMYHHTIKLNKSTYNFKNPAKLETKEYRTMYKNIILVSNDVSLELKKAILSTIRDYVPKTKADEKLYKKCDALILDFNDELDRMSNLIESFDPATGVDQWRLIVKKAIGNTVHSIETTYGIVAGYKVLCNKEINKKLYNC